MALCGPCWSTLGAQNVYNAERWAQQNSTAIHQLFSQQVSTPQEFRPCVLEMTSVPDNCLAVKYFDIVAYFDPDRHVAFVEDAGSKQFSLIFDQVSKMAMGVKQYELVIECDQAGHHSEVVYNVKNHRAWLKTHGDLALARRFDVGAPKVFYKNQRDKTTVMFHDYFKALSAHDYVAAQECRHQIILKANQDQGIGDDQLHWDAKLIFDSYPLMELGEALMLSYPADYEHRSSMTVQRDPYKAYEYVNLVCHRDTLLAEANAQLVGSDIRLSVDKIKRGLESELLDDARRQGTEEAYDRVLSVFYNSQLYSTARAEQEQLVYPVVVGGDQIDALQAYLSKYRGIDMAHSDAVEARLYQVAFDQMQATVQACQRYKKLYPLSPFIEQVKQKEMEYAFETLQPTGEACRSFLNEYPASPHTTQVWHKLYEYAYNELGDDLDACQRYLNELKNSPYNDLVTRKILKIKHDRLLASPTAEACEVFLSEYPYSTYSQDIRELRDRLAAGEDVTKLLAQLGDNNDHNIGNIAAPMFGSADIPQQVIQVANDERSEQAKQAEQTNQPVKPAQQQVDVAHKPSKAGTPRNEPVLWQLDL